jgi:FkbM family methyltransferase
VRFPPFSAPGSASLLTLWVSLAVPACRQAPRPEPSPVADARAPAAHRDILATGTSLYSLRKEELIVRDFFQDRRDGVFLDVGCAWPVKENNTFYLEKHLGWSGVGVDGLPEYAAGWKKKRPRSRFFNYLVGDHSDTLEAFYRAELPDLSAARPMENPGGRSANYKEIQVPTITLTDLLDRNGISHVDFVSMDIENWEVPALSGFDIERFRPGLLCVEAKGANRAALMRYFESHTYRRIERYLDYDQVNYYFAPASAVP